MIPTPASSVLSKFDEASRKTGRCFSMYFIANLDSPAKTGLWGHNRVWVLNEKEKLRENQILRSLYVSLLRMRPSFLEKQQHTAFFIYSYFVLSRAVQKEKHMIVFIQTSLRVIFLIFIHQSQKITERYLTRCIHLYTLKKAIWEVESTATSVVLES